MGTVKFSSWKRGFFRHGKEIKGLRGGVHRYAAQASPQIDAAKAEKNRFRTETNSAQSWRNHRAEVNLMVTFDAPVFNPSGT
ncbi:MAG TPA: hypothetical protein VJ910_15055 [Desulfuromonadales bacterium]|nr:hypothetical protein [Desulfuromonadales bacterium]